MKLSFSTTIQGHEIEFVRLLFPLRYELYFGSVDNAPVKLTLEKDGEERWDISKSAERPVWFNEISLAVQNAIEDNEAEQPDVADVVQ